MPNPFSKFSAFFFMFGLLLIATANITGQKTKDNKRVNQCADEFIKLFQTNLNFDIAFDKMFIPDATEKMRRAGYFENLNLSPEVIAKTDDATLENLFKAFMNFYYLKGVYDTAAGSEVDTTPKEVTKIIKLTKFIADFVNEENHKEQIISKTKDINQFTTELNSVSEAYRKLIPRDVFKSKAYKRNLKKLTIQQTPNLQILDGYEKFGIMKNTKVYVIEKDLFIFYFVELKGQLKVLTLGIGN